MQLQGVMNFGWRDKNSVLRALWSRGVCTSGLVFCALPRAVSSRASQSSRAAFRDCLLILTEQEDQRPCNKIQTEGR